MISTSETIATLAVAMHKAQSEVKGAIKDAENPGFKQGGRATRYADLESVWDACRQAVTGNGLSIIQSPGLVIDGCMRMQTMILHTSGEWLRGELSIPLGKSDAQGYGSATTYARRYALAAMMSVCPEDDDGNAASQPRERQQERTRSDAAPRNGRDTPPEVTFANKLKAALTNCVTAGDVDALKEREAKGIAKLEKEFPGLFAEWDHACGLAMARVDDVPF